MNRSLETRFNIWIAEQRQLDGEVTAQEEVAARLAYEAGTLWPSTHARLLLSAVHYGRVAIWMGEQAEARKKRK